MKAHFDSRECDLGEVRELVRDIRSKEERLSDLEELLK
jgi:hypothetical protein